MIRETIPYTTEEAWLAARRQDLTSTDVAALFGLSPYLSAFELFHRKHGGMDVGGIDTERTRWGNRLEASIARGVAEDQGWEVDSMDEYIRLPEHRIGSSFDFRQRSNDIRSVSLEEDTVIRGKSNFLLECKNVDGLEFRNNWGETDFGLEAPAHIELQVQHQMLVSGIGEAYIAALIGGNRIELLHRFYDSAVGDRILAEAAKFWALTEPPAPDFTRDAALIGRLYKHSDPDSVISADEKMVELMRKYNEAGRAKRLAEDEQQAARAELLTLIGKAERVESVEFNCSAKETKEVEVAAFVRKGYRNLRITERKSK